MATTNSTITNTSATTATDATILTDPSLDIQTVSLVQDTTALLATDPALVTDVPVDAVLFDAIPVDLTVPADTLATINTVTPTLTNNGEPLVVIDATTDTTDVTAQNVLTTDAPPVDTPVVTDTATPVDTPMVTDTAAPVDTPVVTDTAAPVDTPVVTDTAAPVDTPVLVDPLVDTPVDTTTSLPADIDQSAPDQVLTAVITSIVDSTAQPVAFGGSTQDTQPTLSGTSEPGTIVSVIDNGSPIGQAVADDDWHWTFTTTALTSGEVHAFSVDAARADGSGKNHGAFHTLLGIDANGNDSVTAIDPDTANLPADTSQIPLILDDSTTGTLDQLLANAGLTSSTDDTHPRTTTTATVDTDASSSTTAHTCPHAHATHAAHDFAY